MKGPSSCQRKLIFFVLVAAVFLPGARCKPAPKTTPEHSVGPSTEVAPISGSGVSWSYGSFPYAAGLYSADLFDQINLYRTSRGLSRLTWHDGMGLVAQRHALDMNNRKYLAVVSPEGIDMGERLVSSSPRIDFDLAFPFVAFAQYPTTVFSQLLNDPSSKNVIDDPYLTHYGASFQANPGPYYVAIIFARNARP